MFEGLSNRTYSLQCSHCWRPDLEKHSLAFLLCKVCSGGIRGNVGSSLTNGLSSCLILSGPSPTTHTHTRSHPHTSMSALLKLFPKWVQTQRFFGSFSVFSVLQSMRFCTWFLGENCNKALVLHYAQLEEHWCTDSQRRPRLNVWEFRDSG